MAEWIVPYVIERLDDVLNQEYLEVKRVRKPLEQLRMQFVNIFRAVEATRWENSSIRAFAAEAAHKTDDVLDTFCLKVAPKKDRDSSVRKLLFLHSKKASRKSRYWSAQKLFSVHPKKAFVIYNIGKELEAISHKISLIMSEKSGIIQKSIEQGEGSGHSSTQTSYDTSSYTDGPCITGDANFVIEELLEVEQQLRVVTICGMGGLGKTTIAQTAFQHKDVKKHFGCLAWVCASRNFKAEYVMKEILAQLSFFNWEEWGRMKEVELVEKVYAELKKERYLVVVDDIWSVEAWKMLQSAFPRNGVKGSKVVLTTRNKRIAAEVDPHHRPFVPRFLNDEEAWGMLLRLYPSFREILITAENLKKCGDMVKECGGLPLAIRSLSLALQYEKPSHWNFLAEDCFHAQLSSTLMWSYNDLPYQLKPCFLYLGIFPKRSSIPTNLLIQMWIAEGFVSTRHGDHLSLEDVGRRFLDELIQRSLVQVVETNVEGRVKICRLHDMMRYACINKAREENFFEVSGGFVFSSPSMKLQRCAIYLDKKGYVPPKYMPSCSRSAIFFTSPADKSSSNISVIPYKPFKRLRVLDFIGVRFPDGRVQEEISKLIGKLRLLKYLGLRDTGLNKLPTSIGELVCLRFLDVRDNESIELPNVIWKMRQLRCFYINSGCCKENAPLRMDTLRELQVASHITAGSWTSDMSDFTNLRKLGISELTPQTAERVIDSIVNGLDSLQYLSLQMSPDIPFPDLEQLSKKKQLLKLRLSGKIKIIPHQWPSDVVKLRLINTKLTEDPLPLLGNLQKLRYLELLSDAYLGKEMVSSKTSFPRLLYLLINALTQLEVWTVEEEAMPYLVTCHITDCKSLKIPQRFQYNDAFSENKDGQNKYYGKAYKNSLRPRRPKGEDDKDAATSRGNKSNCTNSPKLHLFPANHKLPNSTKFFDVINIMLGFLTWQDRFRKRDNVVC